MSPLVETAKIRIDLDWWSLAAVTGRLLSRERKKNALASAADNELAVMIYALA